MIDKTPTTPPAQPAPSPGYPYAYPYPPNQDEEIDLREYWRVLVDHKKLIALITGVATATALAIALLLTPIFRAEVLLAPAAQDKAGGLGALAGQFGDLAALAGISLGGGDTTQEAIATLKSRALTEAFIKEKNLLPVLFADEWDAEKKKWKTNDSEDIPTLWKAYEVFDEDIRSVAADKKTGLVTLAIEWEDPAVAAEWANELVKRVNLQRQKEAIEEAERSIAYLQKQLARTGSVEVQQSIYRLVEAQTKSIMVAQSREDFAFKVIDPAVPPEEKVKPKRALLVAVGIFGGLFLSVIGSFVASANRRSEERANLPSSSKENT